MLSRLKNSGRHTKTAYAWSVISYLFIVIGSEVKYIEIYKTPITNNY